MTRIIGVSLIAVVGLLSPTGAFAQTAGATPSAAVAPRITDDTKLFNDFGGRAGLVAIMDDFMVNLLADDRTKPFFANVDQVRVKAMLVEQFCEILNGGCTYSGRDMVSSHAGMNVTQGDFFALVEALQVAMDKHGVPFSSQNKLLAALAPQHRDIVTK